MAVEITEFIPRRDSKPMTVIKSDKFNHEFIVRRTNDGFVFYEVAVSKGQVPAALQGRFSRMKEGVEAVKGYIEKAKKSATKRRDDRYKKDK